MTGDLSSMTAPSFILSPVSLVEFSACRSSLCLRCRDMHVGTFYWTWTFTFEIYRLGWTLRWISCYIIRWNSWRTNVAYFEMVHYDPQGELSSIPSLAVRRWDEYWRLVSLFVPFPRSLFTHPHDAVTLHHHRTTTYPTTYSLNSAYRAHTLAERQQQEVKRSPWIQF